MWHHLSHGSRCLAFLIKCVGRPKTRIYVIGVSMYRQLRVLTQMFTSFTHLPIVECIYPDVLRRFFFSFEKSWIPRLPSQIVIFVFKIWTKILLKYWLIAVFLKWPFLFSLQNYSWCSLFFSPLLFAAYWNDKLKSIVISIHIQTTPNCCFLQMLKHITINWLILSLALKNARISRYHKMFLLLICLQIFT